MHDRKEFRVPIPYGVLWDEATAPSLEARKGMETEFLESLIQLAELHGASDIEVSEIVDLPDSTGKVVTLTALGYFDLEQLQESLRKALDGQKE